MNFFDKESNIIDFLQSISFFQIRYMNRSAALKSFFRSLRKPGLFQNWVDNSTQVNNPPDYYNDHEGFMLEVMRIDDYHPGPFVPNAMESKRYNEINRQYIENTGKSLESSNIKVFLIPKVDRRAAAGLDDYYNNFKRIVSKHISKVPEYKSNHPGYKLGFLIFDEAPAYIETISHHHKEFHKGDVVLGLRYYIPQLDRRFIEIFSDSGVDYVIWMTPFKKMPQNTWIGLDEVYLFDLNKMKKRGIHFRNYKYENIVCLECF